MLEQRLLFTVLESQIPTGIILDIGPADSFSESLHMNEWYHAGFILYVSMLH